MRCLRLVIGAANTRRLQVIVGLMLMLAIAGLLPRAATAQHTPLATTAKPKHPAPRLPFSITLRRTQKGVLARINWAANCRDGGRPFTGTAMNTRAIPVGRRGRFSATATFTGHARDHAPLRYQLALSGSIGAGGASRGTVSLTVSGRYALGANYACATGTIRWRGQNAGPNRSRGTRIAADLSPSTRPNRYGFTAISLSPGQRILPHHVFRFIGRVDYEASPCVGRPGKDAPVASATLRLYGIDGGTHDVPLPADGHYDVQLSFAPPVAGAVVLDNARIFVRAIQVNTGPVLTPGGAPETPPFAIPVGLLSANPRGMLQPVSDHLRLTGDKAALASIFETLDMAARVAGPVSPIPLPKIYATFPLTPDLTYLGDIRALPFFSIQGFSPKIVVGSRAAAFNTWDLAHEYGHYVIYNATHVEGTSTEHFFSQVFPDQPRVPWLEGWADAFAAIVTGNPRPMRDCQSLGIDLSAVPAQPHPVNPNLAQYNEIATAGALIGVANLLGSGNQTAGMRPMLAAFHANPPFSTREARDALIKAGVENRDNHDDISSIFIAQNIRWLVQVLVNDVDQQSINGACAGCLASNTVQIVADGPAGRCEPSPDGGVVENGWFPWSLDPGLPFTLDDKCNILGSDGNPPPQMDAGLDGGNLALELPFLDNGSHLEPYAFTVSARWLCTGDGGNEPPDVCTQQRTYQVTVSRSVSRIELPIEVSADITFAANGALIPIAAFDGQGRCKLLIPPGGDCSA